MLLLHCIPLSVHNDFRQADSTCSRLSAAWEEGATVLKVTLHLADVATKPEPRESLYIRRTGLLS